MIQNKRTRTRLKLEMWSCWYTAWNKEQVCNIKYTIWSYTDFEQLWHKIKKNIYLQQVASVSKELLFCFIHVCQNVVSQGLNCDMKKMKYNIV